MEAKSRSKILLVAAMAGLSVSWLWWRSGRTTERDLASLLYELVESKGNSDIKLFNGSTPLSEAQRSAVLAVAKKYFAGGQVRRLELSRQTGSHTAVATAEIEMPGLKPTPLTLIGGDADEGGALQMMRLMEKAWEFGRQAGRGQKISKAERFQACAAGARECESRLAASGIVQPNHPFRGPLTWSELANYYESLSQDQ